MTGRMRTKISRRPAVKVAGMREHDQGPASGARSSIAHTHLAMRRARRHGEFILRFRRQIATRVLRSGRIPDLARKHAVPRGVYNLDGAHSSGVRSALEWIVIIGCHVPTGYCSAALSWLSALDAE